MGGALGGVGGREIDNAETAKFQPRREHIITTIMTMDTVANANNNGQHSYSSHAIIFL
jgi:hypothetical protein